MMKSRLLIVLSLILCCCVRGFSVEPKPLEFSPETTLLTEPLTADGKRIDYLKAYETQAYPKGWNTEQNGYRFWVENLGVGATSLWGGHDKSLEERRKTYVRQMYDKLGITAEPKRATPLSDTWLFLRNLGEEDTSRIINIANMHENTPWTLEEFPEFAPWLEEIEPTLEIVKEACHHPLFCVPAVSASDDPTFFECNSLSEAQEFRICLRTLKARAYFYIGSGELDKAIDDIVTMKRLGHHLCRQTNTALVLTGLAVLNVAYEIGVDVDLQNQADKRPLKRLLIASQRWESDVDLDASAASEYHFVLDFLQNMATREDIRPIVDRLFREGRWLGDPLEEETQRWMDQMLEPIYRMAPKINDWNMVLRHYNNHCQKAEMPDRVKTLARMKHDEFLDDSDMSDTERAEFLAELIMARLLPSFPVRNTVEHAVLRTHCGNNLRQIALAMLMYHEDHGTLPPAFTVDPTGSPLHSWRVLLLPYLGEAKLYRKIRLDEPWDSTHNRQFHDTLVEVYHCPGKEVFPDQIRPGMTTYTVVLGDTTPFNTFGKGRTLKEFDENSRDMILVLETKKPICWMNPTGEITLAQMMNPENDPDYPMNMEWLKETVFSSHIGGFNAAFRSGASTFVSETIDPSRFLGILQGTMFLYDYEEMNLSGGN